jgi:hypothetical protein
MYDYKTPARRERDPDAIVGVIVAASAVAFFVMLWMGVV